MVLIHDIDADGDGDVFATNAQVDRAYEPDTWGTTPPGAMTWFFNPR